MTRARNLRRMVLVGWTSVASVVVGSAVVLVTHAATPADASAREGAVPTDIIGHLIGACEELIPGGPSILYDFTLTPEGEAVGKVGKIVSVNDDGTLSDVIDDEALTAVVNDCLASYGRIEARGGWRPPTPGEQLLIYDWMYRWEVPCLLGHGVGYGMPPYAAFVGDENNFPSYVLANVPPDAGTGFDFILAARTACAPIPPFLRNAGVGP